MRVCIVALAFGLSFAGAAGADDVAGASDHPLVGRYEGAEITKYQAKGYEELTVPKAPIARNEEDDPAKYQALAGKLTQITYKGPEERSALELFRNYQQKLTGDGFMTVFDCVREACGHASTFWSAHAPGTGMPSRWDTQMYGLFRKDEAGRSVWVAVHALEVPAYGDRALTPHHVITVVESQPMEMDKIVLVEASALKDALDTDGSIALYGLYFDTDKAELREDSLPQLEEIAKFLNENGGLDVLVVGHTDNVGALGYNQDLSERRAASVVQALGTDHGIAGGRMTAVGVGMAAPVATNQTEEGRALNRRVELVRR